MSVHSGTTPFQFIHRPNLYSLPEPAQTAEVNLHGTFAEDPRDGSVYYSIFGHGLLKISADMTQQTDVPLPKELRDTNIHSLRFVQIDGAWQLIATANEAGFVAILGLDGELITQIHRPPLKPYQDAEVPYQPTDTVLVGDTLYITDGYGAQYVSLFNIQTQEWVGIFGGQTDDRTVHGKFRTAHGINTTPDQSNLVIADRWNSRLQIHDFSGAFVASHDLPLGAWPCFIEFTEWQGRTLGVVVNLYDPTEDRPAPIYILDANSYEIVSTIRPKEELGIEPAQRLHHVAWHKHNDRLFLLCQSWNPGAYFVLECVG